MTAHCFVVDRFESDLFALNEIKLERAAVDPGITQPAALDATDGSHGSHEGREMYFSTLVSRRRVERFFEGFLIYQVHRAHARFHARHALADAVESSG